MIVGGESGPQARPMQPKWVREIRGHCVEKAVPFFFKQWGGGQRTRAGRVLDGRTWMNFRNRCRKLWGSSKSNELPQGRLFTLEGLAFQDKSSRSREIRGACGTLYSLTSRINVCSFRFCFP